MNGHRVYGIVDFHTSPSLGILTANRPLGSTSFLGRYALCDFALSNFTNSGIDNIGLLIKDHQRSILKHVGSMHAWVNNTKRGKLTVMYNEYGPLNPKTNTDARNIMENDYVLYASSADYLVFQSSHIVANIDLRPIIEEHIERGEAITVLYKKVEDISKEFTSEADFDIDEEGYVTGAKSVSKKRHGAANASMGVLIINRMVLAEILPNYTKPYPEYSIMQIIGAVCKAGNYRIHAREFLDFALCIDSYDTYCKSMFAMLDYKNAHALLDSDWEHLTKTHDSVPALYGEKSDVKNSYIANGCIIEGKVENCILGRDVRIGEGTTVRNCIIFSNVNIGDKCNIENVLLDKYSIITKGKTLKGENEGLPTYYRQGFIL